MTSRPGPGEPSPRRRTELGGALVAGWRTALIRALLGFAAVLSLGQVLALLQAGWDPIGDLPLPPGVEAPERSPLDVVRAGGLSFFQFHMVTMEVALPPIAPPDGEGFPFGAGLSLSFSFAAAAMGGMAVAGGLLFWGGRSTARSAGGPPWALPIHGAKVAVPYAALALLLSFVARPEIPLPSVPGTPFGEDPITIQASPISALLWTLLLGAVAGGLGGLHAGRTGMAGRPWGRRTWGVLAGGWRMTWVALSLSFVGLLVLAAVHPGGTRAYFRIAGDLQGTGTALFLVTTLLFLPNMATWVLAGSVGGSAMAVDVFGGSCSLLSYGRFPRGVTLPPPEASPELIFSDPCRVVLSPVDFSAAPAGYFAFLLVPLVAVLLGGFLAARLAGVVSRAEGAAAGAAAGAVFGLIALGLLVVSRFVASIGGFAAVFAGGGGFAAGPELASGFFLTLAWGVLGGALGGFLAGPAPVPPSPESGFEPQPPAGGAGATDAEPQGPAGGPIEEGGGSGTPSSPS